MALGATHVVNSLEQDPVEAVKAVTGGGADFSLEATGRPDVLRQAIEAIGVLGMCGIVGAARLGAEASFDVNDVMIPGKTIRGILQGESVPKIFIPQLVELHRTGPVPVRQAGEVLRPRRHQHGGRGQREGRDDQADHPSALTEGVMPAAAA